VSVIMGAESSQERNAMTMELIEYAFNHYETEKIYKRNEVIGQFSHIQSERYNYDLKTSEPISILRKKGEKDTTYETKVSLVKNEQLPIAQGEQLGSLVVHSKEKPLTESPLYANEPIEFGSIITLMKRSLKMM